MSVRPSRNFLQMISSAVLSQALLSAANFLVGLILIRRTAHEQYGYYVLIITAVQLLTQAQLAFIYPSLMRCLAGPDRQAHRDFIGGVYRFQRRLVSTIALIGGIVPIVMWYAHMINASLLLIVLGALFAAGASMYREYFRVILLSYRLPLKAFQVDLVYVVILCGGAFAASLSAAPALMTALTMGGSALIGGWLLSLAVRRLGGWNIKGSPSIFSQLMPLGFWALVGAAIHWSFAQGFLYIVAGTLDVRAVAAVSATRLLLMPVNLMSSGLGSITFPTVSHWVRDLPVHDVFKRLCLLAVGIAGLATLYIAIMWFGRDWIFTNVTKGHFDHRDTLLAMWSLVFLLMAVRDQMLFLPAACGRYRIMAALTLVTAILSLVTTYVCMKRFGVVGALTGVLAGEAFNILCFIALSLREISLSRHKLAAPMAGTTA